MSRFVKVAASIILAEIIFVIIFNLVYTNAKKENDGFYRVEAERIAARISAGEENIDLSGFKTVTGYKEYNADEICNEEYVIKNAGGRLYRITYHQTDDKFSALFFNAGLGVMILITVLILWYINVKIVAPFHRISNLTLEIAKGNLSNPIKQEKRGFLGKFLWGVDMLREKIEDGKSRNLEYEKEKKILLLSLSHDIKTPLSAINLYVKAMLEGIYETEEEKSEALNSILDKTSEIKGYVDEIYTYTRDEFMNFEVNVSEVYIEDVMGSIRVYYKDKLSVLHTKFEIEEYGNCLLSADSDRLVECIQNLMENAIKYGDGRSICISFDDEEDCKLISVENSGCTLSEDEMNNIFDSFYRGANTAGIQGNGLGLYIVRKLMRLMGGDVYASKTEDTFTVTLVVKKV